MALRLAEIVARLGGELREGRDRRGDAADIADIQIVGVNTLAAAGPAELSFLANSKYRAELASTRAAAVILGPNDAPACPVAAIVSAQPYLDYAKAAQWLNPPARPAAGVHPSAVLDCTVPPSCFIGAQVVIAAGARIAEDVLIEAGCIIGENAAIGPGSRLHPRVTIYPGCVIGARAIIHSGAVIGADGFGFAREPVEQGGAWVKIVQAGGVVIGDDVEIGANTTIDRGALADTVIEDGVKLDNQIQVAHNVRIGAHSAIAGCVGIAGSARIGRRCTIGGGAVILGHLDIHDDSHIAAGTLIAKSITRPGSYTGTVPFQRHADWLKNFAHLRHLNTLADKIRALENRNAAPPSDS